MTQASKKTSSSYQPGYETIAAKIIELIKAGSLQPGDRLPTEQRLGEQLGVSRAMVREAIKLLTASGHVRTRRGSGIYVNDGSRPFATAAINLSMPVDPEHMRALFEFRSLQEAQTVKLAAERITLAELRGLEQALIRNREGALANHWDMFIEYDDAFHSGIARASHNPFLLETVETVLRLQRWTVKMATGGAPGSLLASVDQHQAIFTALKDGKADVAVQAMKDHIDAVLHAYLQDVRRRLLLDEILVE
ncbi:FadR family transcriptional regulator [Ktedonosporobacter rubrisoli]|uniref:FadR family transcriptional regulator n=1 Tax=Ktedonosporobacter rubrisoli TaxID=2509675 RepID=A0A4P6K4G6_KTERU|nr:FadR/GntR family transcriptional regulator [Ktedonosporobacter rubrisoli]QBD83084.1 FadR family transcriptional regulator [Ktedonosporobacter rubrisoli]